MPLVLPFDCTHLLVHIGVRPILGIASSAPKTTAKPARAQSGQGLLDPFRSWSLIRRHVEQPF